MNRVIIISILLLNFSLVWAQQESPDVRRGNKEYNRENYTEAEVNYRRGLEQNSNSFEGCFNLGDALFRQEKYPEAIEQYQKAERLLKGDDKTRKEEIDKRLAATYHNMGNAFYAQQQYDKSVMAYQQALRHNPKDNDTRYNLVKAMQQLQQQQQNQEQKQDQQQQNDSTQQQQEQQPPQPENEQQREDQMDKETAEQILQALEQDEQETQEKLQRQQGKKKRVEKNW